MVLQDLERAAEIGAESIADENLRVFRTQCIARKFGLIAERRRRILQFPRFLFQPGYGAGGASYHQNRQVFLLQDPGLVDIERADSESIAALNTGGTQIYRKIGQDVENGESEYCGKIPE
jgi:hypothetical protein